MLSTFLSSSLNIELVYIILSGITRFSNSTDHIKRKHSLAATKGDDMNDLAEDFDQIKRSLSASQDFRHQDLAQVERALRTSISDRLAFEERQRQNHNKVDPFEHIREMQLNKIRINNFRKWDIAKYDEFICEGYTDYDIGNEKASNQDEFLAPPETSRTVKR